MWLVPPRLPDLCSKAKLGNTPIKSRDCLGFALLCSVVSTEHLCHKYSFPCARHALYYACHKQANYILHHLSL